MKILLFDIETAPNLGYIWGKYEQDVLDYVEEGYMLCFAYKWLGEKDTICLRAKGNRTKLVKALWKLFNEADVIIAHHGDQFDIKKANAYFAKAGLPPPSPYKTVDTKKVAKRYFKFNSNKLDDLGNYLGLGRKLQTGGFELWKGCMRNDKKSWAKMMEYNCQDVILLEEVYIKLLPWITNHPDRGQNLECPNCKGKTERRGFSITRIGRKQRYQCQECGAWSLGKTEKHEKGKVHPMA